LSKISWLLSSTALIGIAGGSAAVAAEDSLPMPKATQPAVSDINAKFDLRGGFESDVEFYTGVGSVTAPIGDRFGVAVDGLLGAIDGDLAVGGAAHLFWRNPDSMMLGAYAEVSHAEATGGGTLERGAAEVEFYFDRLIAAGVLGYQAGDLGEGFFSKETLSFYATEDFRLYGSHRYEPGPGHSGAVGAEWLTPAAGHRLAVFGEGRINEDGEWGASGGVRLYFGPQKSLMKRHVEDDPVDHFDLFLQAAGSSISQYTPSADPVVD
jgi:hypothetical protein